MPVPQRLISSAMGTGGLDILIAYALLILCHSLFEIVITHFWGCAMMWLTNRNFYKELIQKAGAETELVYMKASKDRVCNESVRYTGYKDLNDYLRGKRL